MCTFSSLALFSKRIDDIHAVVTTDVQRCVSEPPVCRTKRKLWCAVIMKRIHFTVPRLQFRQVDKPTKILHCVGAIITDKNRKFMWVYCTQPNKHPTYQPNQQTDLPTNQSTNQPTNQHLPINQSTNKPTNQLFKVKLTYHFYS